MYLLIPSSISHLAFLTQAIWLLVLVVAIYRRTEIKPHKRIALYLSRLLVVIVIYQLMTLLIGMAATPAAYALRYGTSLFSIVLFFTIYRLIVEIDPSLFSSAQNRRYKQLAFALFLSFVGIEISYTLYRLAPLYNTGSLVITTETVSQIAQRRPFILEIPLIASICMSYIALARRFRIASQKQAQSPSVYAKIPTAPDSKEIFRGLMFSLSLILVVPLVFIPRSNTITSWINTGVDTVIILANFGLTFIVLQGNRQMVTFLGRLVGAGVSVFLGLASILGWVFALRYSETIAPDLDLAHLNAHFSFGFSTFIETLPYRADIHMLLLPVAYFVVIGSFVVGLALLAYYRRILINPLSNILSGIKAVEGGNLDAQITTFQNDELGQIAVAFNNMSRRISRTNDSFKRYQARLEEIVEQRTDALLQESEQRKVLEIQQAIQTERERIARETHDGLMQRIAGTKLRIAHWHRLVDSSPSQMHTELDELETQLVLGTIELRQLINDLNFDALKHDLQDALTPVIYHGQKAYELKIHADIDLNEARLTASQSHELFRIIQETISNCGKHAHAQNLWIAAYDAAIDDHFELVIQDDGIGFDLSAIDLNTSMGIRNIRTRTKTLNGEVQFDSVIQQGTTLAFLFPYATEID